MKNYDSKLILLLSVVWIIKCVQRGVKNELIQYYSKRTGEPIAVDSIIQEYEREHQKMYNKETENGTLLKWPDLDKKNLSNYCRKYLQYSVPTRCTDEAIGTKLERILYYMKENTSFISIVVIVKCKIMYPKTKSYYMTRTPEPNCVYALKCTIKGTVSIIHKHCDFEDMLLKICLKRKRKQYVSTKHRSTGQPIAKNEHLLKYELEHRELLMKEGQGGKFIYWPYAMAHNNLHAYCCQYLRECVPQRKREGITVRWKTQKLHYQKLNAVDDVEITTVTCMLSKEMQRRYHITRALEPNCVYALLRPIRGAQYSFLIIYKHCGFEDANDQENSLQDYKKVIPKSVVKEETLDTLETLQLFPNY